MSGQPSFTQPPPPPEWEKEHLWLYLLALGFDAAAAASSAGKVATHLRLGPNMFDKPNKDAFHIITCFLFSKLDRSNCNEVFRFCFPPADKKEDAEFRKQCCEWLRRISDECGNNFPPVVPSLFLSPGGPKFVHLMFHFARYVIIHHIKTDASGNTTFDPEAVRLRSSDLYLATARYRVAQNNFLKNLQKEDNLIQELQKKATLFNKQIKDLRHEDAELNKRLQKIKKNVNQSHSNQVLRVEKVRCMWSFIMETLEFLQKEREVVESVIEGHVDQYVLDGTSVAVSVPRLLLEKVEKEIHKGSLYRIVALVKLKCIERYIHKMDYSSGSRTAMEQLFHIGNVYEAGKLNILTIIQLLNKALELLMHESQHIDKEMPKLDLQYFEGKTQFQNETVLGIKSLRQKLKCEDHVSINKSIAEKQREWDLQWENYLGQSPFNLIKDPNPVLDLLPAMSPLSFTPATEESYKTSIFCQYPASILDSTKKKVPTNEFERDGKTSDGHGGSSMITSGRCFENLRDVFTWILYKPYNSGRLIRKQRETFLCLSQTLPIIKLPFDDRDELRETVTDRIAASPHSATEPENRTQIPSEKWSDTPKRIENSSSQILRYKGRNRKPVETWKKRLPTKPRTPSSIKREEPREKALEHLAEEVAGSVVSGLPENTVGKGEVLEDLFGTIISDPFVTKKQLPRTPENLITEIRNSWKKAIRDEDSSNIQLHHTEENTSQNTAPVFKKEKDSSIMCFMSPCMSDTVSPFLEQLSPFSFQKGAISRPELLTQQTAIEPLCDKIDSKQELIQTDPNKFVTDKPELVLETVSKSIPVLSHDPSKCIAIETLSPYPGQNSSLRTTLSWDASQMVSGISSDSHEVVQLGILQETLPDEGGFISLDISDDLGADAITEDKSSSDNKALSDCVVGNKHKLDFQSIRSRYEALKNAIVKNKDSLSSKKQIPKCRSEYSLSPVTMDPNVVLSPLGKPYALDAELFKTPLHAAALERENTLSPFPLFSPLQPRERPGIQD